MEGWILGKGSKGKKSGPCVPGIVDGEREVDNKWGRKRSRQRAESRALNDAESTGALRCRARLWSAELENLQDGGLEREWLREALEATWEAHDRASWALDRPKEHEPGGQRPGSAWYRFEVEANWVRRILPMALGHAPWIGRRYTGRFLAHAGPLRQLWTGFPTRGNLQVLRE